MSSSTTVLASVNICVASASTFLIWVCVLAFLLTLLEKVDLQHVVIISTCFDSLLMLSGTLQK